ncbi:winged helix-turn-helix domain-containing protein [Xanthobacter autotrophicus]|uniref:winged helix-turn-helix domain-containing protein n=1 Tax=Xanthobacter autotrophicus TaxID=280 RepID=UPI0037281271
MDTYLDLAETVLRAARRPLPPRAILSAAYKAGIVPSHLFGKTQHKTLQARLSEDILRLKLDSRFYRTGPGMFFLSELRSDPDVPDEFKDPFHARRRTRDLTKPTALAISKKYVDSRALSNLQWNDFLRDASRCGAFQYVDARHITEDFYLVWAFSIIRRNSHVLSYRIGRYRDNRDAFANKRSIGFSDVVSYDDATLFNDDLGVTERGLSVILDDLDLSRSVFNATGQANAPHVLFSISAPDDASHPALLFVMEWDCPDWFEPTSRRLSLNEVRWIDATRMPNDLNDFEPWSSIALAELIEIEKNVKP